MGKNILEILGKSPFFTAFRLLFKYFFFLLPINIALFKCVSIFYFIYSDGNILRGFLFYSSVYSESRTNSRTTLN